MTDEKLYRGIHPSRTGEVPPDHLTPTTSDRGLRYLPPIALGDGQEWKAYTSSSAEHASIWIAINPVDEKIASLARNTSHLTVEQAWEYAAALERSTYVGSTVMIVAGAASSIVPAELVTQVVDQLRWVVEHHHWGDMRPKTLQRDELFRLLQRVRQLGDKEQLTNERVEALTANARDLLECVDELEALLRG